VSSGPCPVLSGRTDPSGLTVSSSSGGSPLRHAAEGLAVSVFGLVATLVVVALLVARIVGLWDPVDPASTHPSSPPCVGRGKRLWRPLPLETTG